MLTVSCQLLLIGCASYHLMSQMSFPLFHGFAPVSSASVRPHIRLRPSSFPFLPTSTPKRNSEKVHGRIRALRGGAGEYKSGVNPIKQSADVFCLQREILYRNKRLFVCERPFLINVQHFKRQAIRSLSSQYITQLSRSMYCISSLHSSSMVHTLCSWFLLVLAFF